MTISAKVVGGEYLRANLKTVLTVKGKAILKRANQANAKEFAAMVRIAVPQDPRTPRHLVDTVEQKDISSTGAQVSIGSAEVPYPLHLETGHRMPDGVHIRESPAGSGEAECESRSAPPGVAVLPRRDQVGPLERRRRRMRWPIPQPTAPPPRMPRCGPRRTTCHLFPGGVVRVYSVVSPERPLPFIGSAAIR